MSAKQYFDFEYDNKHIQSIAKEKDLISLYALMDEYCEVISKKYAKWFLENFDENLTLTEKEYFEWFKSDEQL